jgi:hypothetical protein
LCSCQLVCFPLSSWGLPQLKEEEEEDFALIKWQHPSWETPNRLTNVAIDV